MSDAHAECLRRYPETRDASCLRCLNPVFEPDTLSDALEETIFRRIDVLHRRRLTLFADDAGRP